MSLPTNEGRFWASLLVKPALMSPFLGPLLFIARTHVNCIRPI